MQGNYIGIAADGVSRQPNRANGVRIHFGVSNLIGGDFAGARNVISGNGGSGVLIQGSAQLQETAFGNTVAGNYMVHPEPASRRGL